jgi:hypothetical protein
MSEMRRRTDRQYLPDGGSAESFLANAIESAIGQTYLEVEVLVIEDGSPIGHRRCAR